MVPNIPSLLVTILLLRYRFVNIWIGLQKRKNVTKIKKVWDTPRIWATLAKYQFHVFLGEKYQNEWFWTKNTKPLILRNKILKIFVRETGHFRIKMAKILQNFTKNGIIFGCPDIFGLVFKNVKTLRK